MSQTVSGNSHVVGDNNYNSGNIVNSYNNKFSISISEDKGQVLEWLSPVTSRERHHAVRDSRVDEVGNWLLREPKFSTWHTSGNTKPVLLCHGDPGVGKTYLSSLVIDTLSQGTNGDTVATTYVYCDFTARDVQSTSTLLGSVLRQVVAAMTKTPGEVLGAFEHAKKQADGCKPCLPEILTMLIESVSRLKRSFICIDALDEFPQKQRPELWQSLQRLIRECPNTRLFLTGRPHVVDEVGNYFPETVEMLQISTHEDDIGLYLRMRLDHDPEPDAMNEGLRADILRDVPERISGMFLLVRLNVDAILEGVTVRQRRQALNRMTKGSGLQDAYDTTIDRIRQQGGNKARLGLEALMWISRCEHHFRAGELCHALGVELGVEDFDTENVPTIRTVLGCTLGLVTVDEKYSWVRLLHLTLQEYLGEHPSLFATAHSMMAEVCLTYLNTPFVRALPRDPNEAMVGAPFLLYATTSWGTHTSKQMTKPLKLLALKLLDGYEDHVSARVFWRGALGRRILGKYGDLWLEPNLRGISGLHCIAFWGIAEIAIAMLDMKRWDVNAHDSEGGTPLSWALKYGTGRVVELFAKQRDIEPDKVIRSGRTVLSLAAELGNESVVKLLLEMGDVNPDRAAKDGRTPLSYAASSGSEGVVKLFLERGDVNHDPADNGGRTPLSYAAGSGNEGVVKLFLERGDVNPGLADQDRRTPLSYAAKSGSEGVVKLLLERGDVNAGLADNGGRTPLSYAARSGSEGVVKLLLERGDVNADFADNGGRTPLSYAVRSRSEGVVKLLLERGDVNADLADNGGQTPLSHAVWSGSEGVVKLLLERGDVNADSASNGGRTPLSYAVWSGSEGVVKLLLERRDINADSADNGGRTPLSYAAESGSEGVVKLLLERGDVNANLADNDGGTPLSYAAASGCAGVVKLLLERGDVSADLADNGGRTPLSFAAETESEGVVKLLLERGDVNADLANNRGRTPLSYAAWSGSEGVVKLLLERGDVNPDSADNGGLTPLSYAAESGSEGVVKLFLERGDVNPDSPDNGGRTPLSYAAESGSEAVVKLLLERGTLNPNIQDNNGQTPLSYAAQRGYQPVLNLLSNYGVPNRRSSGTGVQTRDSVGGKTTPEKDGTHPLPLLSQLISPPEQRISSYSPPPSFDLSRIGLLGNNLYRFHSLPQISRTHPIPDPSRLPPTDPE